MHQVVIDKIKPTKEYLKEKFKEYNALYFNNCLSKCRISVIYMNYLGQYIFQNNTGHIYLSKRIDNSQEFIDEVLIHEMIHHYVRVIEGRKGGLFGHNWRFRRQCRRLKKEFGLIIK